MPVKVLYGGKYDASRPSRGAWIEIHPNDFTLCKLAVAPLAGRVD